MTDIPDQDVKARPALDAHVREIVRWHFSAETGSPFWLEWARKAGWDPVTDVNSFADLVARFPHFQDEWLRDLQPEVWVPKKNASGRSRGRGCRERLNYQSSRSKLES